MRTATVPAATRRRGMASSKERVHPAHLVLAPPPVVEPAIGFGPHLVFDGHGCAASRLRDVGFLYGFLERLPDEIGMTRIMPPYVFRNDALDARRAGLSGFVLIAESHISVHAFPRRRFVNVDVFSCEPFDVKVVLAALRRAFAPRRSEWKLFDRGLEFPKSIGSARQVVQQDRAATAARGWRLEVSR